MLTIDLKCNEISYMKNYEYVFMYIFTVRGPQLHEILKAEVVIQERLKMATVEVRVQSQHLTAT